MSDKIKLVLITNGSLADRPRVQEGLRKMAALNGEVWFKFDRATASGMRAINQTRISPEKQFERLAVAAALCPTWLQTCVLAVDGAPPSEAEQAGLSGRGDPHPRTEDSGARRAAVWTGAPVDASRRPVVCRHCPSNG